MQVSACLVHLYSQHHLIFNICVINTIVLINSIVNMTTLERLITKNPNHTAALQNLQTHTVDSGFQSNEVVLNVNTLL